MATARLICVRCWSIHPPYLVGDQIELPQDATEELVRQLGVLNTFDVIAPLNKATIVTAATSAEQYSLRCSRLFGMLSILAAVLLIFLIFIMLAAERRSEIGIARAVGTQRRQVVQMFITEGMVYAMAASALGVIIGIAVTFGMTRFMEQLFSNLTGQLNSQTAGSGQDIVQHQLAVGGHFLLLGRNCDLRGHCHRLLSRQPHEHCQCGA